MDITSNLSKYYGCSGSSDHWHKVFPTMSIQKYMAGDGVVTNNFVVINCDKTEGKLIFYIDINNIKANNIMISHLSNKIKLLIFTHHIHMNMNYYKFAGKGLIVNHRNNDNKTYSYKIKLDNKVQSICKLKEYENLNKLRKKVHRININN